MAKKGKKSGKAAQNPTEKKTAGFGKKGWIILGAAALVIAVGIVLILVFGNKPEEMQGTEPGENTRNTENASENSGGNPQETVKNPIKIDATDQNMGNALKPEEVRENEITGFTDADILPLGDLGEGLTITRAGSYTGQFVEDGKNLPTENVLSIVVTNHSDRFVEHAQIAAVSGTRTAIFKLTSLPAGQSVLVMEKNNSCCEKDMTFDRVVLQTVTKPDREFSLYPDVFEIKAADGVVNLINKTEIAYPGKIAVYFKNAQDGIYIGGITYTRTLENGIPAGGIAQFMADNYTVAGSELVFIDYVH